ncbi:hypothetical protein FN846DRAFT_940635 [Sphaerosporella brunnea]|uniref:Uncharacterized protein n=1 Tax=Sphaerosporella brunnea TaxID=1250544 RepID=A0A5J5F1U2_9PEZI|nr:hypothetical protein FN846DRAFT_940635 [Sphaerosporella brunnea]
MVDNPNRKKRSYSNMTKTDADARLGFRIGELIEHAVPAAKMLSKIADENAVKETKEKVYRNIVDYLEVEGYPSESRSDFKEANISDLVYATIIPIISDFKRQTRCALRFQREDKEIVSVDSETGGTEAFVLMDLISVAKDKFVFVVEAKRSSVGEAMKQLLLAMKDARDIDNGGTVYGFTTTGDIWQMVSYNGEAFEVTEQFFCSFSAHARREGTMAEGFFYSY